MVAQGMLEKIGCRVELARDGQEAVELVSKRRFHLVFMDCQMPVLDGLDATRTIRRYGRSRVCVQERVSLGRATRGRNRVDRFPVPRPPLPGVATPP